MKNATLRVVIAGVVWVIFAQIRAAHHDNSEQDIRLLNAAERGSLQEAVRALDDGASVDAEGDGGYTALMCASRNGHELVVALCAGRKANVHSKAHHGCTALHLAAGNGHLSVVEMLATANSCLDEEDKNGNTAWQLAKDNGHSHVAAFLQKKGAKVDPEIWDYETTRENSGPWEVGVQSNPAPGRLFQGAVWGRHTKLIGGNRDYGTLALPDHAVRPSHTITPPRGAMASAPSQLTLSSLARRVLRVFRK